MATPLSTTNTGGFSSIKSKKYLPPFSYVKLVAKSVESVVEIVANLGLTNQPTPEPATIPIVETIKVPESTQLDQEPAAPLPSLSSPSVSNSRNAKPDTSSIGNIIDIATTLAQERNPIDAATFDYLQRLKVAGRIYDMQYSSIQNFFGVFITVKDYPHLIPWWDAVPQLQQLYPHLV